ncbi:MAG: hypothetical protein HY423_10670 [Candidatus Lambdaproteobacteria bacterium]|nr:hypothetical protein [Candidatus Lambdaproteobacteria bacterium]
MFIDSVLGGFALFAEGRVWLGLLAFVCANALLLWGLALLPAQEGCLVRLLLRPTALGLVAAPLLYWLLPVLLGRGEFASLELIWTGRWLQLKAGLVAVALLILIGAIPFLGGMVAGSWGLQTFLYAVLFFRFLFGDWLLTRAVTGRARDELYPGLFASLAYLLIAWLIVELLRLGLSALLARLDPTRRLRRLETRVLAPTLGVLGGLLPFFMYVAHVRLAVGG